MNIESLDDDEFAHLVQWLAAVSTGAGVVDLRHAPAWKFAQVRAAVDEGRITQFPDVCGSGFRLL